VESVTPKSRDATRVSGEIREEHGEKGNVRRSPWRLVVRLTGRGTAPGKARRESGERKEKTAAGLNAGVVPGAWKREGGRRTGGSGTCGARVRSGTVINGGVEGRVGQG